MGRRTQVVRERSAKPLCIGSNPIGASKPTLLIALFFPLSTHDCTLRAHHQFFPRSPETLVSEIGTGSGAEEVQPAGDKSLVPEQIFFRCTLTLRSLIPGGF